MSSLMQLKAQNESRLAEEKRLIDRRRNVLVMMLQHCTENGYLQTAEKLQQEAGVALSKFEVVENLDLLRIVQEYEDFQEIKFGKRPKLVRRLSPDEQDRARSASDKKATAAAKRARRNEYTSPHMPTEARVENNVAMRAIHTNANNATNVSAHAAPVRSGKEAAQPPEDDSAVDLGLVGHKPAQNPTRNCKSGVPKKPQPADEQQQEESIEERLLKPLPSFAHDLELRPLAETITREIFQKNPDVRWDDVIGLQETKRLLKEAVVMPLNNLPWDLDAAMLRRLEKRVLVDLPTAEARHALFASLLEPYTPSTFDFSEAVKQTEGYSGADIKLVAKEACMAPVRRLMGKLEAADCSAPSSNQGKDASAADWREMLGSVQPDDVLHALQKTKPSAQQLLRRYQQWQTKFGST
ncbi:Katanin p60 ATPase-containing subunit A-like 2 [Phytophthora ramorum]